MEKVGLQLMVVIETSKRVLLVFTAHKYDLSQLATLQKRYLGTEVVLQMKNLINALPVSSE